MSGFVHFFLFGICVLAVILLTNSKMKDTHVHSKYSECTKTTLSLFHNYIYMPNCKFFVLTYIVVQTSYKAVNICTLLLIILLALIIWNNNYIIMKSMCYYAMRTYPRTGFSAH